MIRIVQGNPGSGKSYYAVNYLSKYCTYDALYKDHKLNDGVLIISNLEGLKLKHLDFDELVQRFTLEKFLTIENFEKIIEKYKARHIILIIDESQKYLDSKFYDKDVFYFFQYHRHIGIDVFLLTQSVSTVCRQLPPLCEFIIEAAPRSKGIAGTFRYKFKDTKGTFMYSQAVRKKQEVFAMYKSFSSDEAEKPKNVLSHWLLTAAVVICVITFGFKGFFYAYAHKGESAKISVPQSHVVKPAAPSPAPLPAAAPAPVSLPATSPAPSPIVQPSSVEPVANNAPPSPSPDLPRVVGRAGDVNGLNQVYMLSTGEIVKCKRLLSIGQVYIR